MECRTGKCQHDRSIHLLVLLGVGVLCTVLGVVTGLTVTGSGVRFNDADYYLSACPESPPAFERGWVELPERGRIEVDWVPFDDPITDPETIRFRRAFYEALRKKCPVQSTLYQRSYRGFPWRCLEYYEIQEATASFDANVPSGSLKVYPRFAAPHVLWRRALGNVVAWAVAAGLLYAIPRSARRYWRRRKGRCAHCAYDLSGCPSSLRCPECGTGVQGSSSSTPSQPMPEEGAQ